MFTIKPTNLKKSYFRISKKRDQPSINLANVFNFKRLILNYVGFDEIKWLCALSKYTTQKFITKPQPTSMSRC